MRPSIEIMNELMFAEKNLEVLKKYQADLNFGSRYYEDLITEIKNTIQILKWVVNNDKEYENYKMRRLEK